MSAGNCVKFISNHLLPFYRSPSKFVVMLNFKKIGTHNGTFHCDEVLGCFMLKLLCPESEIVRTRDPSRLDECDIVIDVGGEYNPSRFRFDHHQRDFDHSMKTLQPGKPWETKLSSAGLVYCHFGKEIVQAILHENADESLINAVYDKVYEELIQEVDGIDNGIPMFSGEPKYRINTNLSSRIKKMNRNWTLTDFDESEAFNKAMALAGSELVQHVKYAAEVWYPAKDIVLQAIDQRFEVDKSGEIIELSKFCPWEKFLHSLEKEMEIKPPIKFVLFTDSNNNWRVQSVSIQPGSFLLRLPLMESWRGLRDDKLSSVSGIEGCVFVHSSGFIGGCKTREGVLSMAQKTLDETKASMDCMLSALGEKSQQGLPPSEKSSNAS